MHFKFDNNEEYKNSFGKAAIPLLNIIEHTKKYIIIILYFDNLFAKSTSLTQLKSSKYYRNWFIKRIIITRDCLFTTQNMNK